MFCCHQQTVFASFVKLLSDQGCCMQIQRNSREMVVESFVHVRWGMRERKVSQARGLVIDLAVDICMLDWSKANGSQWLKKYYNSLRNNLMEYSQKQRAQKVHQQWIKALMRKPHKGWELYENCRLYVSFAAQLIALFVYPTIIQHEEVRAYRSFSTSNSGLTNI